MACPTCGRRAPAGACVDGYVHYLAGDYPCPFNPDPLATVKNPVVLAPLNAAPRRPEPTAEGLEDLL